MRREFELPEADLEFLASWGRPWETIKDGNARFLLMHDFPLPAGYNVASAIAAFEIESQYPDTQLDMVYFHPGLSRTDGGKINNLSTRQIDGKEFQRWSRHRTAQNAWRAGEDYLGTHVALVQDWLQREFGRG